MIKRVFFLISVLIFSLMGYSQTVENIKVEPEGDDIRITYRIGDSAEGQLYNVRIECSLDGGDRFTPVSVIGDVGENIRGGKSYYTILWEVFKDLEKVGEAEFFITVKSMDEDSQGKTLSNIKVKDEDEDEDAQIFVGYSGCTKHYLGVSGGYMENWGFYGAFRMGFSGDVRLSITGGLTKRIKQQGDFTMHAYLGGGRGDYLDEWAGEVGLVNVINNRFNVNIGATYVGYYFDITFGFGIVF